MRQSVLDRGYVELREHMGGDAAVVEAARICYQSEAKTPDADEKLIHRLLASEPKHNTVFEHAVFRFGVKCPLFVARQWMRHRMGTFCEKSLRFCLAEREYYIPGMTAPELRQYLIDCVRGIKSPYGSHAEISGAHWGYVARMESAFDTYENLVAVHHWPREQARGVLGTAVYTEFVWTVNAWSLMNWMQKRLDKGAQWEHCQYAEAILKIFRECMPITAAAFCECVPCT